MVSRSSGLAWSFSRMALNAWDFPASQSLSFTTRCRWQTGQFWRMRLSLSGTIGIINTTKQSVVSYDSSSAKAPQCGQAVLTRWMRRLPQYQVPIPLMIVGMSAFRAGDMKDAERYSAGTTGGGKGKGARG